MVTPIRQTTDSRIHLASRLHLIRLRDKRLWMGILLLAFSSILGQKIIYPGAPSGIAYVLTRNLEVGQQITATDLALVKVSIPDSSFLVSNLQDVVGKTVQQPLFAGSLLDSRVLALNSRRDLRTIAIPLRGGHVPPLQVGSVVDVWFTPSLDGVQIPGPSRVLVKKAVVNSPPNSQDSQSDTSLTLAVSPADVQRLVQAMRDGTLDVVALTTTSRG